MLFVVTIGKFESGFIGTAYSIEIEHAESEGPISSERFKEMTQEAAVEAVRLAVPHRMPLQHVDFVSVMPIAGPQNTPRVFRPETAYVEEVS